MISLQNHELDQKIKALAKEERELLREVIEHIREADMRRLYLGFAHPSLFEYLVKGCGYSAGSAQRRIDAARLLAAEPALAGKIESGDINLSQVSLLQKAIRQKDKSRKSKNHVVTNEEKRDLIAKICNKSSCETQKIIAQDLNIKIMESPKETHQKDESVRLEVTLTKEQWQKLEKARALASNATQSNDWGSVLEYLAEKLIRQKEGSTATMAVKKQVLQRDQGCQYQDKSSGRVCGSQWNLHVDHVQPKWANGTGEKENLQILCQKHNHHRYRQQTGVRFVN